jgi:hypothetical protein
MTETQYQRLTRARSRGIAVAFASASSLWLADDHLLCIDSNGYAESYRRFYFRDIQALILQRTARGEILSAILGFIALLFVVFCLLATVLWVRILFGSIAAFFGLCVLANWLCGPTCKCLLRTAVQEEELPSLRRVKWARRAMARLSELIAGAQGGLLTAEDVAAQMREWAAAGAPGAPRAGAGLSADPPPVVAS